MAVDTALFVLGLDSTGIPDTIAITLLTSNTYKIGSASKTFAQCYDASYFPNDSATVAIVANEGLSIDFTGGGTATSASASLTATAALETTLNLEVGLTGVFDVTAVFSDPSERVYLAGNTKTRAGFAGSISATFALQPKGGGGMQIVIQDVTNGTPVDIPVIANVVSGQRYRMAFSVSPNLLMLSVNGADAVSRIPSTILDISGFFWQLYAGLFNARVGSSARIGDALYYPLQTDPNILKRMSK